MKVLVTGASGQVGAALIKQAEFDGIEVISAPRSVLDISNFAEVEAKILSWCPDVIINAAAYTAVDLAEKNTELAYLVNDTGVANLAILAADKDIPVIHISTDYVFDGRKDRPYVESDETCPINVYGESKLRGEKALTDSGAKHVIVRTSWVFGLDGKNFPNAILNKALGNNDISIVSDQIGGPTFAPDIAKTLLEIAKQIYGGAVEKCGTYHYSGWPYVTWWEFGSFILNSARDAGLIDEALEIKKISSLDFSTPADRPANSRLSGSKLEESFDISPSCWRTGIQDLLKDIKNSRALDV